MTWGQVKLLTSPLYVSQWGKYWNPSQCISKVQFFQGHVLLGHPWWPKVKCWLVTRLRSSEVTRGHQQFLPITWAWEELETWKWSQCLCLVNTLRLICNFGHVVTLTTWDKILTLTLRGQHVYLSKRLYERNTMPFEFYLYRAWFKSYKWKTIWQKDVTFTFHDLWRLTYWPCIISDGKTLPKRFMSYLLLF